jgi:DNA gyrase/topoisomerase IV subunit B
MIEKYNLIEHIRLRPGMYIGSKDYWGYSQLLSYLIMIL